MEIDFSGDFLNFDSSADGDICEILDEGKLEFNKILNKEMFNLQIRKSGKVMTWSPNNEAGRILQQSFGKDSKSWIGRKFQVFHIQKLMKIRPVVEAKV